MAIKEDKAMLKLNTQIKSIDTDRDMFEKLNGHSKIPPE